MQHILSKLQRKRNFEVESYLQKKIELINQFFRDQHLDSAVVGLSGGIDSAVSIMLLKRAAAESSSPIRKILAVIIPIVGRGTTHQVEATSKAVSLIRSQTIDSNLVDLTDAFISTIDRVNPSFVHGDKIVYADEKADSKLASYLRTAIFYYHKDILASLGMRSIVIGTINRDEGSYIGEFDTASDAVADLQLIGDLHKSELIKLGYYLGVLPEIVDQSPRGDHYDVRNDEEILGVPYWFIEMYILIKDYGISENDIFRKTEKEEYQLYSKRIEELHEKHQYKYQISMYCHFLDVMKRKVDGGW